MEQLQIVWSATARKQVLAQNQWYQYNCGLQFASTFADNIKETAQFLSFAPSSGTFLKESNDKTYRSYLAHPKTRMIYWYNDKIIKIIRLRFNRMSN